MMKSRILNLLKNNFNRRFRNVKSNFITKINNFKCSKRECLVMRRSINLCFKKINKFSNWRKNWPIISLNQDSDNLNLLIRTKLYIKSSINWTQKMFNFLQSLINKKPLLNNWINKNSKLRFQWKKSSITSNKKTNLWWINLMISKRNWLKSSSKKRWKKNNLAKSSSIKMVKSL